MIHIGLIAFLAMLAWLSAQETWALTAKQCAALCSSWNDDRNDDTTAGCRRRCVGEDTVHAEVKFTEDGPDQIGLRRNFKGNNLYTTVRERGTGSNCGDFGHAFFAYPSGQNFISPGQSLSLAAAGVRPSSQVTFRFRKASGGADVATFVSRGANGNCVMNEASFLFDAARFSPGLYTIFADYSDGNSVAAIFDDPIAINGIEVRPMKPGSRVSGKSVSIGSPVR
jgi:hypothetical protein